ncbi:MAG: NAD(P)-dependent oxidoreductase [Betaproteobacteria bacterium]|jgi:2-hydroxy-3-oxopropionate reductase|nr:NAD(P)-dependent oxidoreductase [Betaproteobacteria bacterium]
MHIGFIGLGAMGRHMAGHLLKAGHHLGVWARRADSAAPLVAAGATRHETPSALAAASEVVITMVTTAADVEQVLLDPQGVIHGARPGSVVIDMETISPVAARALAGALAARGVEMLDAPVSGGPMGAEQASLSIMVGGKPEVFERMRPVLACMGKTITRVGDIGAGQVTKACNQLALLVAAQGIAEALNLATRLGADPGKVREVMMGGVAASRVMEVFGTRMVSRDFANGIDTRLYHKDLGIVLELAHGRNVPVPAAALVLQQINALMAQDRGRDDLAALIKVLEQISGTNQES